MELKEIIQKLKESEVDSGIIDAVKGLDQSDEIGKLTKELEGERGKNAGILEDKKKFKERAEAAEKTLKEHEDSKLTDEERTSKQVEELQTKLDEAEKARAQQEQDFKAQQRETALADITSSINWATSVPKDTAKLIVKNAFADTEDISDKTVIESTIKAITENHKSFISAEAPAGSGGQPNDGTPPGGGDGAATMGELMNEVWAGK